MRDREEVARSDGVRGHRLGVVDVVRIASSDQPPIALDSDDPVRRDGAGARVRVNDDVAYFDAGGVDLSRYGN